MKSKLPNPGQPLLDENVRLREAIVAMTDSGDLLVALMPDDDRSWAWNWGVTTESGWHGTYTTAADAALAGLDKMKKEKQR